MREYIKNLAAHAGLILGRPVVDGKRSLSRVLFGVKPNTQGECADPEDQLNEFSRLLINDVLTVIEKKMESMTTARERDAAKVIYFAIKEKYSELL